MTWRSGIFSAILGVLISFTCQESFAKCANMKAYYCTSGIFEKEMPELNIGRYGKQYCSGSIVLSNESTVTAVFLDKESCPVPGSLVRSFGHTLSRHRPMDEGSLLV